MRVDSNWCLSTSLSPHKPGNNIEDGYHDDEYLDGGDYDDRDVDGDNNF